MGFVEGVIIEVVVTTLIVIIAVVPAVVSGKRNQLYLDMEPTVVLTSPACSA